MLDKKELNVIGGNWLDEIGDFIEDTADKVWDGVKDVTNEVVDVT